VESKWWSYGPLLPVQDTLPDTFRIKFQAHEITDSPG